VVLTAVGAAGGLTAWVVDRIEKADQRKAERAKKHADELRLGEMAEWASEAVAVMQSLVIALQLKEKAISSDDRRARILVVAFQASILVERGRLFFKNTIIDDFGSEKEPAYRGYRPLILDQLVVACQVANRFLEQQHDDGCRLLAVAEDATRRLVSLVQTEVGRSRSASADTSSHGDGANLDYLLSILPKERTERLCPSPSLQNSDQTPQKA
jgi:hypothetical protein